ncbi:MAG: hypothetical protein ACRCYO_15490 [Bacteroidia bacterium]
MLRILLPVLGLFFSGALQAQNDVDGYVPPPRAPRAKPFRPSLQLGAAFAYSVINNRKEVRGLYKPGIDLRVFAQLRPAFGVSLAYTHHLKHNSSPALEDIYSYNFDLDGHLIMRVGESDLFFSALFGLTYLNWRGTYVGPTLNDNNQYYYGLVLKQPWIGANMGIGCQHVLWRSFTGFGEFRMRFVTVDADLLSISDTAFRFGVRSPLAYGKPKKHAGNGSKQGTSDGIDKKDGKPAKGKDNNGKSKGKYNWLKKRN